MPQSTLAGSCAACAGVEATWRQTLRWDRMHASCFPAVAQLRPPAAASAWPAAGAPPPPAHREPHACTPPADAIPDVTIYNASESNSTAAAATAAAAAATARRAGGAAKAARHHAAAQLGADVRLRYGREELAEAKRTAQVRGIEAGAC